MPHANEPVLPGVHHDPEQADLDSMAARSAGGESGSEGIGGAPRSNTAPHNSIGTLPDGFRLLDWLLIVCTCPTLAT